MSLSPKHSTPFSVTDILSPLEECYKKVVQDTTLNPSSSSTNTNTVVASSGSSPTYQYHHHQLAQHGPYHPPTSVTRYGGEPSPDSVSCGHPLNVSGASLLGGSDSPSPGPINSVSAAHGNVMNVPVSSPYMHVPQLSHPNSFSSQYCNGTDIGAHYGEHVRQSAAGWYGTAPDPRFASK